MAGPTRRRDAGLTLVEVLVTLAIIAVAAGVAVLGVGASDRRIGPEVEARRLAARLNQAVDRATVSQRPQAFRWEADGYSLAPADDAAPERHAVIGGARLSVTAESAVVAILPEGAGQAFEAEVLGGGRAWRVTFDGLNAVAAPAEASQP